MEQGIVTWWNPVKGWGRIRGTQTTYFFRRKWVAEKEKERNFRRGEKVLFSPDRTARGPLAYGVERI